jgi:hypothetical protein
MIRDIKAFGLAFAAVIAVSAVAVSAARAEAGELHIGAAPAVLTGSATGKHLLMIGGLPIECTTVTLEGKVSAQTTQDVTLTPYYSQCQAGAALATVKLNGCKYTLESAVQLTAKLSVVGCTTGKTVYMQYPGCTITFGTQGSLSHVIFENEEVEGQKRVVSTFAVTGVTYQDDGLFCHYPNGETRSDGEIIGTTVIKAYQPGSEQQVTKLEHQYVEYGCGSQVALFVT